jgi:hypothetical protein
MNPDHVVLPMVAPVCGEMGFQDLRSERISPSEKRVELMT